MGWRDSINQNLAQSNAMTIELANNFDPKNQSITPGFVLSGHVIIRPVQTLKAGSLRVTLYGISDAHILRKLSTIQNHYYGRGFLFQEIKNLTSGSSTLEPVNAASAGHRFPFSFTIPETTTPMAGNTANFNNKWKPRSNFAGAEEMHSLPPSLDTTGKHLFGYHESSISYRLDASFEKSKGGTSTMWLPQVASSLYFSPVYPRNPPDPQMVTLTGQQHQLRQGSQLKVVMQTPSIACAGAPFPMQVGCEGAQNAILTALEVKLKGEILTRARNPLLGEKVVTENREVPVGPWTNPNVALNQEMKTLQQTLPLRITPTFRSFTVALPAYEVVVKYTVTVGNEILKGEIQVGSVHIRPGTK